MPRLEFESLEELRGHLDQSSDLTGAVFQSLDLTQVSDCLRDATLKKNVLLGCQFDESLFDAPTVFPLIPDLPFNPYPAFLYSSQQLLAGYQIGEPDSYRRTLDGRVYQHYLETGKADAMDVVITLIRRLHDHGITDALQEFIEGKKIVAIMGGHSMRRDDPMYLEVARLSRDLVHGGFLPISGGGPGAMEATNLGAWFAERGDSELLSAIEILSTAPLYEPMDDWLDAAFTVVEKYPLTSIDGCTSLGIPTWLYGHEPPNCFATHVAKYFANSVREEGLLAIAKHGVIFSPGSAGTIQEIFQDACQNHYKSFGIASPMIFMGEEYWKSEKPVYPLLTQLATGRDYGALINITDKRHEIMMVIDQFARTQTV